MKVTGRYIWCNVYGIGTLSIISRVKFNRDWSELSPLFLCFLLKFFWEEVTGLPANDTFNVVAEERCKKVTRQKKANMHVGPHPGPSLSCNAAPAHEAIHDPLL